MGKSRHSARTRHRNANAATLSNTLSATHGIAKKSSSSARRQKDRDLGEALDKALVSEGMLAMVVPLMMKGEMKKKKETAEGRMEVEVVGGEEEGRKKEMKQVVSTEELLAGLEGL